MKQFSVSTFVSVVAIFAILLLLLSVIINNSTRGRAISFQNIEPQTDLEDTGYMLEYTNHNVVLRDKLSRNSLSIVQGYSPVASPPAYDVLRLDYYRIYLITRLASGGNSGAYWYKVFRITADPVDLTPQDVDPQNGLSCVDPRFDEDRFNDILDFERGANCADSAAPRLTYEIKLT